MTGYLVLETGEVYSGVWQGGKPKAGEIVFNTSHSGYEEIATDPSYYNQIMIMTTSQTGNYGHISEDWESDKIHINGFLALEIQSVPEMRGWLDKLLDSDVPVITELDTRSIVLRLREAGTTWGAVVQAKTESEAKELAKPLIQTHKSLDRDWAYAVTTKEVTTHKGDLEQGPKIAVMDFGCKQNILRELKSRSSEVTVFPSRATAEEIREYDPDGIMLSNGPGDPSDIESAVDTIKNLLEWRPIFGICMGHHLLCMALGAKTYKLKFGHRGSNHPIRDGLLDKVYVTSQNHGYAVDGDTLPKDVEITHMNLNDNTVAGISCLKRKCFSVQYHPENRPGPKEAEALFDHFIKRVL